MYFLSVEKFSRIGQPQSPFFLLTLRPVRRRGGQQLYLSWFSLVFEASAIVNMKDFSREAAALTVVKVRRRVSVFRPLHYRGPHQLECPVSGDLLRIDKDQVIILRVSRRQGLVLFPISIKMSSYSALQVSLLRKIRFSWRIGPSRGRCQLPIWGVNKCHHCSWILANEQTLTPRDPHIG